jgi:hypothetical protein
MSYSKENLRRSFEQKDEDTLGRIYVRSSMMRLRMITSENFSGQLYSRLSEAFAIADEMLDLKSREKVN